MARTPDLAALNRDIDWLECHPDQHVQRSWRCNSGMCLAGWHAELSNWSWFTDSSDPDWSSHVVIDTPDHRDFVAEHDLQSLVAYARRDDPAGKQGKNATPVIHVQYVAEKSLGLTSDQAAWLFDHLRTLDEMRAAATTLASDPGANLGE